MFFGGFSGATAFHADTVVDGSYAPPIVLTDFRLSGIPAEIGARSSLKKSISYAGDLTLSHEQNVFSLTFAALSYLNPATNRYRYKLEGLDHEWNEVGSDRRLATYTTLPAGRYTFRAQGATGSGAWSEPGVALRIEILRPWWGTSWFRAGSAALILFSIWLLHRAHIHQVKRQFQAGLEERVGERTRIAQELHDTLLQGFLSASMQLHVATDSLPSDSPSKPPLSRVLQLMARVTEEGRNAVRGLRSSPDPSLDLAQALSRIPQELSFEEEVDFRVIVEGQPQPLHPVLRDEAYRIGREALINAFRHSRAKKIEVELEYGAKHFRLLIRDNGCGIDPGVLRSGRERHWGLLGMRERAEKVGARLNVRSRAAAGTEVEMSVPSQIAFQFQFSERPQRWFAKLYPRKAATNYAPAGRKEISRG